MPGLANETILMNSDDNSVTLTTHRVLFKTSNVNKEIMLKDLVSHEIIKKRANYYKKLLIFFGAITILAFIIFIANGPYAYVSDGTKVSIFFPLTLTGIALFLFLDRTEKYLKLSGRFNEIEFSLSNLSESSLNKFLNRLIVESDNRKRES